MVASSPSSVEASSSYPSMAASSSPSMEASSSPSMEASSPSMEASLRSHGAYSTSGMGSSCCPPVFDPYTLIGLIGGIALATYFLRLVIVVTTFTPPKKRSFQSFLWPFPSLHGSLLDEAMLPIENI